MDSVSFSIQQVNRLRRAAEKAREIPSWQLPKVTGRFPWDSHKDPWDGWTALAADRPNALLSVFDALWLKPGFALHAYVFRTGHGGNGVIWAVPSDAPLLAPKDCIDGQRGVPQPPGAIPLMQAIEGDGTPWSYLSASILRREAAEFGAFWHGLSWSVQTILSKSPRQAGARERDERTMKGDAPIGAWDWQAPVPRTWKPTYTDMETTKQVVLHAYDPVGREVVYRAADTYRTDSYDCRTQETVLCFGGGGIVF